MVYEFFVPNILFRQNIYFCLCELTILKSNFKTEKAAKIILDKLAMARMSIKCYLINKIAF